IINSLYIEAEDMSAVNTRLQKKYADITKNETRVEEYMTEDAEYIIAAFGTTARVAKSAAQMARKEGLKVGVIRPITLWPFPTASFEKAAAHVRGILTVEMNAGQMVEDVRLAVEGRVPVEFYGTTGGFVPEQKDILKKIYAMKEGK
ncbi:MAG: transketolase C-terminal domain-containing protein, partial [Eubacteriales bacterium]